MKTCLIGGTGRCGTSLVKKILARHKDVGILPVEHRFTIDPDGIIDFYHNYTTVWSPYWADTKLKRLEKLLYDVSYSGWIDKSTSQLLKILKIIGINISPKRYIEIELNNSIPNFSLHINKLMNALRSFHYEGSRLGTDSYKINPKIDYSGQIPRESLKRIFQEFFRNVIGGVLKKQSKNLFVEDNTWNILFASDLLQLISGSKLISVIRDPRDVVASLSTQKWMPTDKEKCAMIYKDIMSEWKKINKGLPKNLWMEIKLENLIDKPENTMRKVTDFIGLSWEEKMINFDLSKGNIGRWIHDFSNHEKEKINLLLQSEIEYLGYHDFS